MSPKAEIRTRLLKLLSDVLQQDVLPPFEQCTLDNINEWDSIAQLNLILSVEGEFNVTFSMETVIDLNSLERFEVALRELGAF